MSEILRVCLSREDLEISCRQDAGRALGFIHDFVRVRRLALKAIHHDLPAASKAIQSRMTVENCSAVAGARFWTWPIMEQLEVDGCPAIGRALKPSPCKRRSGVEYLDNQAADGGSL